MVSIDYFVLGGALLNFLRKRGAEQHPKTLVSMCVDAASGMEYLEEKNCIHRSVYLILHPYYIPPHTKQRICS